MRKRNYIRTSRSTFAERKRKIFLLLGIPLAVYFLIVSVFGEMGVVKYYRMRSQHERLRQEIAELTSNNVRLMHEVRVLRTDPAYIEKLARDKLGLARNGEIVYYYDDAHSPSGELNPR